MKLMGTSYGHSEGIRCVSSRFNSGTAYGHIVIGNTHGHELGRGVNGRSEGGTPSVVR
jgi:hypothetical protein